VSVLRALVREVPASIGACQLTWQQRRPIDPAAARREHAACRAALEEAGYELIVLAADEACPDCCFVEDVVLDLGDGLRILTTPGAASRRAEVPPVRRAVEALGPLRSLPAGLSLDGGDVLQAGGRVFVGRSTRTDDGAIEWLAGVSPRPVVPVALRGVLHLKTGVTALDDSTLIVAPGAVDLEAMPGFEIVEHPQPNVLRLADRLVASPETAPLLRSLGHDVVEVAMPELARAEAGLTCMSVLLSGPQSGTPAL
jgi:dimethylargininase